MKLRVPHRLRSARWSQDAWFFLGAGGVLLIVAAVALTTFRDYGIGWDSRVQATYGHKLLSFYVTGFADRSAFSYADLRYYGGFFDLAAAILNHLSPFGEYQTRHLLTAAFFVFGLMGAWRLTRFLAGTRAALIALVALATTPLLYGHAFMNPKDTPFAWLLIWVTYFACRILRNPGGIAPRVYIGFAVSLGLALGTRVFAFAYLAYLLTGLAYQRMTACGPEVRGQYDRGLLSLVWCIALACAVMFAFWPWAALGPANFLSSVETFLHFPHRVPVLWDGELFSSTKPPPEYLLTLLAVQIPEYLLVGLVLAIGKALWHVKVRKAHFTDPAWAFLGASVLLPLVAFTILRPTVYNGLRQFLFIVPPLGIMAAIGWDWVLSWDCRRTVTLLSSFLLIIGVGAQVFFMCRMHPYEYIAFNSLAGGLPGAAGRFELDYWGMSLAEASRDLGRYSQQAHLPITSERVFVCGDRSSAEDFLPPGFKITATPDDADFIIAPAEPICHNLTQRPMRTIAEVKRLGVVLSRVYDLRAGPNSQAVVRQSGQIPNS